MYVSLVTQLMSWWWVIAGLYRTLLNDILLLLFRHDTKVDMRLLSGVMSMLNDLQCDGHQRSQELVGWKRPVSSQHGIAARIMDRCPCWIDVLICDSSHYPLLFLHDLHRCCWLLIRLETLWIAEQSTCSVSVDVSNFQDSRRCSTLGQCQLEWL